jgi:hypothetical protein
MKKIRVKLFLFVAISFVIGLIFGLGRASAAVIASQAVNSQISQYRLGYDEPYGGYHQTLGSGISGEAASLSFKLQWNDTPYQIDTNLSNVSAYLANANSSVYVLYSLNFATDSVPIGSPYMVSLTPAYDPAVVLDPDDSYRIIFAIAGQSASQMPYIFGSSNPSDWPNGAWLNAQETDFDGNVKDIYFSISSGAPTEYVDLTYPEQGTIIENFDYWEVETYLEEGDYTIFVNYGNGTGDYDYSDYYFTNGGSEATFNITKKNYLDDSTWYAQAEVYDNDTEEIILTSSEIYFNIYNEYSGGVEPPTEPPDVECGTDLVCQLSQWIATSLNQLLSYLFIPSSSSVNRFQDLFAPIENKPPIGYFTSLKTQFLTLNATTPVFELEGADDVVGSAFGDLRTNLSWALWLLFAMWAIRRISHLEL